jgi:hypothetical protein
MGRAIRAYVGSVLACAILLFVWTLGQHALSGRWDDAGRNAVDVALSFGGVFAVVAATLHVPIFLILTSVARESLTRPVAVLVGAVLAPAVYLALALAFRESEGPQTPFEWVHSWAGNPGGLLAGIAPFALAGAVFGLAWVWPGSRVRSEAEP